MSLPMGAVLILPAGLPASGVLAALPPILRPIGELDAAAWPVRGLADGKITFTESPLGFSLLTLLFSGTELVVNRDNVDTILQEFGAAGARIGARFGYLSRYEHEFGGDWLEQHVLVPLLMDEPGLIPQIGFERIIIPPSGSHGPDGARHRR